jgi:hypothetical protein
MPQAVATSTGNPIHAGQGQAALLAINKLKQLACQFRV